MDLAASWDGLDLTGEDWPEEPKNSTQSRHQDSLSGVSTGDFQHWSHSFALQPTYSNPYPPYPNPANDFTSQQAAQALTALAQPSTGRNFASDEFPDCCQPCDQQCNPEDIFQCFSVDTVPCYDTRCSQTCEFDGVNTLCHDTHLEGLNDIHYCLHEGCSFQSLSEAELLHHCTIAHACGARTHWECRNQTLGGSNLFQSHVHNEHCRDDEFINPLLLHPDGCSRRSTLPSHSHPRNDTSGYGAAICSDLHPHSQHNGRTTSKRCCSPADHNNSSLPKKVRRTMQKKKAPTLLKHTSNCASHEPSASTTPTELTASSPTMSVYEEALGLGRSLDLTLNQVFSCSWVCEESSEPCSVLFDTALELQTHVEESHLTDNDQQNNLRKGEKIVCRWQGCPFAENKKRWRQVQHLKDHVRTHTKRELLYLVNVNKLTSCR